MSLCLAKMRLLFAFHLFKDAPALVIDYVTSVALETSSWFAALRHALAWIVTMDASFFPAHPFEAPVDYICQWIHTHRDHGPGQVRRLYQRALRQGCVVGEAWTAMSSNIRFNVVVSSFLRQQPMQSLRLSGATIPLRAVGVPSLSLPANTLVECAW